MANKVLLKKSSVAAKIPLTTDLDYGELALNYADGKLYFKNSSNAISLFESGSKVDYVNQAGAGFDFNNAIPSTCTIYRIIWNTGDANMVNSPNGNTSGFLFASQGSHSLWNGQFFLEQGSSNTLWIRGSSDSGGTRSWGTWKKLWHDGNDGAGSGLDADLLDGQQGVYFLNTSSGSQTKTGNLTITGDFAAATKSFLIDHPTKPKMKLRYGSLEGPENGVYVRGRVKENIIVLPEYWTKLIDPETITVNLTPIGNHQNLFVEKIEDNKVYIKNSNLLDKSIDCYFTVFAERCDVDKLRVEYAA